jgi:hypothetical protein
MVDMIGVLVGGCSLPPVASALHASMMMAITNARVIRLFLLICSPY